MYIPIAIKSFLPPKPKAPTLDDIQEMKEEERRRKEEREEEAKRRREELIKKAAEEKREKREERIRRVQGPYCPVFPLGHPWGEDSFQFIDS
jgi:hypothetical protein